MISKIKLSSSQEEFQPPTTKKAVFLSVILIIVLGFTVYGNSLKGAFIWDDEALVENNKYIRSWQYLPKIFTSDIGAGYQEKKWNSYRPLQVVTYMFDYSLWKLDPKGYRLTNVLLHISAALSLYWLIRIIFKENMLALMTSIFFIVHPVHSEAVSYISGRADPLALLFMLLCFVFYLKSFRSKPPGLYILMNLSYIAALFSKENSLILPLLILLFHYVFRTKIKTREFLSIIALTSVYILLRVTILKNLLTRVTYTTTLMERLPGVFAAVTEYIRLLFFPFRLHMEYGNRLFQWGSPKAIFGIIILAALLIFAFKRGRKDKLISFSAGWFLLALLPVSNLFPINAYMAEHWLYLPSIGFFLVVASGVCLLYRKKELRVVAAILVISILGFYSVLTIKQNLYWREPLRFYKETLKHVDGSPRIYNNLGALYQSMGKNSEAINVYMKAVQLDFTDADIYFNLGNVYVSLEKYDEAIRSFRKAVDINSSHAQAYNNLGMVYQAVNKNEAAINAFEQALKARPDDTLIYFNLANSYAYLRKYQEAIDIYKKAIEIQPNYADAYNNLGWVYNEIGDDEKAIAAYKKAEEMTRGER